MATYIIGDVHGAYQTLMNLMHEISYDRARDTLYFVGDLVNNGPNSVSVLRFAMQQGAVITPGNHDLHMLAVMSGAAKPRKKDTFHDVLDAPDASELGDWLRHQPMLHEHPSFWMVHAGLLPEWSLDDARRVARDIEEELRGDNPRQFFDQMYGNEPALWSEAHTRVETMRLGVNAMTRMRALHRHDGSLEFSYKSTLQEIPDTLAPWFTLPHNRVHQPLLFFGHWSALGLHHHSTTHTWCLDSGCTWGETLTAYRLDDHSTHSVPTVEGEAAPHA